MHFWPTEPKIFLKAPIYTNFAERVPKTNAIFLSKFSKKFPKTAFLPVFQKFACGAEKLAKTARLFSALGELRKSLLVDPKKGRPNFRLFLKIRPYPPPPPPFEKILDPPLGSIICFCLNQEHICVSLFTFDGFMRVEFKFLKQLTGILSFCSKS